MADLYSALSQTTNVTVAPVTEPLNAPTTLSDKVSDFFPEEVYDLSKQTHLNKFLSALLGDAGVGGIKKALLYTRMQTLLSGAQFQDLDAMFGGPLNFPRISSESYTFDPSNEVLTGEQWITTKAADASYRTRFLDFVKGVQIGLTETGVALLGRAAVDRPVQVFERWKYLDDIASDAPLGYPNIGYTTSRNEFTVLPQGGSLTSQDVSRMENVFNRLSPSNMIATYEAASFGASAITVNSVTSSSNFFYTTVTVTGNNYTNYPGTSSVNNTWIVPGSAIEKPSLAFNLIQENVNYPNIVSATASTYHVGAFNITQQSLFTYLDQDNIPSPTFSFTPDQAYLDSPDDLEITTPWIVRSGNLQYFFDQSYPLGYLGLSNSFGSSATTNKVFWASEEQSPDIAEVLTLNLGIAHPINVIEFNVCRKPIDIAIFYLDNNVASPTYNTYVAITPNTDNTFNDRIVFDDSAPYPWFNCSLTFTDSNGNVISTNSIQVIFTRREDPFPFSYSSIFPWSIEVENLRVGYISATPQDFVSDTGTDFLGNTYTTSLTQYGATAVLATTGTAFWQSQANPSKFAVESLYFDISSGGSATTFDQIYLNPITVGNKMHVYYSSDDTGGTPTVGTAWDNKLWSPVPQTYFVQKGYQQLPNPVDAKYVKLEFTFLTVSPYDYPDNDNLPLVEYNTFPSWVSTYFNGLFPPTLIPNTTTPTVVQNTLVNLGVQQPPQTLMSDPGQVPLSQLILSATATTSDLSIYQSWNPSNSPSSNPTPPTQAPQVYPNNLFQLGNILATVQNPSMKTQVNINTNPQSLTSFNPESPPNPSVAGPITARSDNSIFVEKTSPDMFFYRDCRHAYMVNQTTREQKIAYFVAINEIGFYRTNYTVANDPSVIFGTLGDIFDADNNTFYLNNGYAIVSPTENAYVQGSLSTNFGYTDFDSITFTATG